MPSSPAELTSAATLGYQLSSERGSENDFSCPYQVAPSNAAKRYSPVRWRAPRPIVNSRLSQRRGHSFRRELDHYGGHIIRRLIPLRETMNGAIEAVDDLTGTA